MRFDELIIEKYGVYSSKKVDLSHAPGLAILYGPNEAGKSTTLAAVVDLLYGIPARTLRSQVFGGPAIALRGSLRLANGTTLKVKRTKGNLRTLTDCDGAPLDEAVLSTHLGANDRERFEALFALNHESLRSGGQQLLDAKGDIGRLIVEAGGGLRSLASEMADLSTRADAIYSTRRAANRLFYAELDRYHEAEKEMKFGLVTYEAYARTQRELRAASRKLEELREQLSALRESQRSLERMARVCPLLHQLARYNEDLAHYSDLPDVSSNFALTARELQTARKEAQAALATAESALAGVNAQIDAIQVPESILDAEGAIVEITEAALHVSKERTDRGGRVSELAKSQAMLEGLRRLTGLSAETDIAAFTPAPIDLDRVRALAAEAARFNAEIRTVSRQVRETLDQVTRLRTYLTVQEAAGSQLPLGYDTVAFASLDLQNRDVNRRREEIRKLTAAIERSAKALGFEGVDLLAELRVPDESDIKIAIERSTEFAKAQHRQQEIVTQQSQRKSLRSAEIARLRSGGEIPTKEAVESARGQRSAAFEPIKQVYLADHLDAIAEVPLETRTEFVRQFVETTGNADRLVDRASEEAKRVAALRLAQQELGEAESIILIAKQEIQNIEMSRVAAAQAWALSWPEAASLHPDPASLKLFAVERTAALSRCAQLAELIPETDRLEILVQSTLDALSQAEAQLGISTDDAGGITARVQNVIQRSKMHDADYADYRAAQKALQDAVERQAREERTLADLQQEQVAWQEKWIPLMASLHVSADTSPEAAADVAAKWSEALGVLTTIAVTQQRLNNMDRDENRLREKVAAVSALIEGDLPTDVVAAAEMLKRRIEEAKRLQGIRNGLKQQMVALTPAREKAIRDIAASDAGIFAHCAAAGCEDGGLAALAARFDERSACLEQIRQTEVTLLASGDDLPIAQLRGQLGGRELDEILAALESEKERERALRAEHDVALKEEERLKRELAGFAAAEDTNRPVAEKKSAEAALQQSVADYLELVLARELIEEAMAVVREEQQDPLLARAGALFQRTTIGAFSGIRADVDDRGNPSVVGVRAGSGERVTLDAMSDGTRDQLFLAFRVAAVEQYCANAEPLPFIADDLLVHFDDGRSQAALELLAELGKTTQVLLFTHHAQVRDSASDLVKRGLAGVVDLG